MSAHRWAFLTAVLLCSSVTAADDDSQIIYMDDAGIHRLLFNGSQETLMSWPGKPCVPYSFAAQDTPGGYVAWTCVNDEDPYPIYLYNRSAGLRQISSDSHALRYSPKAGLMFQGDSLYFTIFAGSIAWAVCKVEEVSSATNLPRGSDFGVSTEESEGGGGFVRTDAGVNYITYQTLTQERGHIARIAKTDNTPLDPVDALWTPHGTLTTPLTAKHKIGHVIHEPLWDHLLFVVTRQGEASRLFLSKLRSAAEVTEVTGIPFPEYDMLSTQPGGKNRQPSFAFVPDDTRRLVFTDGAKIQLADLPSNGVGKFSRTLFTGSSLIRGIVVAPVVRPTEAPATPAPPTSAPDTPAPPTPLPDTPAPATDIPETPGPATPAPATPAPDTPAPVPRVEDTATPAKVGTSAPVTAAPPTDLPLQASLTEGPQPVPVPEDEEEPWPIGGGQMWSFIVMLLGVLIFCCGLLLYCHSKREAADQEQQQQRDVHMREYSQAPQGNTDAFSMPLTHEDTNTANDIPLAPYHPIADSPDASSVGLQSAPSGVYQQQGVVNLQSVAPTVSASSTGMSTSMRAGPGARGSRVNMQLKSTDLDESLNYSQYKHFVS